MGDNVFQLVLELENTPDILDFSVPNYGFLLWPHLRCNILKECLEKFFPGQFVYDDGGSASTGSRVKLFAKSAWGCVKPWPTKDIFLLNTTTTSRNKIYNGKLYNHEQEPLAELFPKQSLYVDASLGPVFLKDNRDFPVRHALSISLLAGKMTCYMSDAPYLKVAKDMVAFLKNRIVSLLNIKFEEKFYDNIEFKIIYLCKFLINEYRLYKKILPKKLPKLFIIQCAHYGAQGHLISLIKEQDGIVAEDQHGILAHENIVYNWAEKIRHDKRMQQQAADVFLTYGDYWSQFFNAPGKHYTLGNAWFDICCEKNYNFDEHSILFTLTAKYDVYVPIVNALQKCFPHKKIIIRPHPRIKDRMQTNPLLQMKNIEVDLSCDVYETLQKTGIVIGDASASLFEAAAMGKRVFIFKNVYSNMFPEKYFNHFASAEELIAKMQEPWTTPDNVQNVFFNRNWKENYINFVHSCGI